MDTTVKSTENLCLNRVENPPIQPASTILTGMIVFLADACVTREESCVALSKDS